MKRKRSVNPFAVVKKKRKQRLKKLSLDRSDFAKQIRRFSRKKGKIQVLPNELEWEMFPFKDNSEYHEKDKGILDYEESRRPLGEKAPRNERR
jgi:hypothetical protein